MKSSRSPLRSKHLRTQVCLTYFLSQLDTNIHNFDVLISLGKKNLSGLPARWKKNEASITEGSIETILKSEHISNQLIEKIKRVDEIFKFPLFDLLDRGNLPEKTINNLVNPWIRGPLDQYTTWRFPADSFVNQGVFDEKIQSLGNRLLSMRDLTERGDVYAFTATVALLRLFETKNRAKDFAYLYHMADELSSSVIKIPIFAPHADLLFELVCNIRYANSLLYKVDSMSRARPISVF